MPRVVIYGCKQVTAAADVFWNLEGDDEKFGKSGIDRNSCFPFETVLGSKARRLESSFLISSLMRNSWVLRLTAAALSFFFFHFFFLLLRLLPGVVISPFLFDFFKLDILRSLGPQFYQSSAVHLSFIDLPAAKHRIFLSRALASPP